jgi:hypothetical protein
MAENFVVAEPPCVTCGRPADARGKMSILTGGSTAIMCPAFHAAHDRWPRWGPRSSPKQTSDLEGRDTGRVLRIVGSTDRHLIQLFHPGINARFSWLPTGVGRLPRAPSWPMPVGPSRCSIPTETARWFDRLKLAKIEVTDRLQRCASRSAAILYGSVLHAKLTPWLCLAWSGFDGVRQDEGRHGAVGEVDAVRGDVSAL